MDTPFLKDFPSLGVLEMVVEMLSNTSVQNLKDKEDSVR